MPQAIPGVASSTPPTGGRSGSLLRVVSPAELDQQERERLAAISAAQRPQRAPATDLTAFVRHRWEIFRNARNTGPDPLNERLLRAQRMFDGQYEPSKLAAIRLFQGSEVYSRLVAGKCRGATSLLRDVYMGVNRPWGIAPQPDPPVPPSIRANIMELLSSEVMGLQMSGVVATSEQVHTRYISLMHAAQQAALRVAMTQAANAGNKMDDILKSGMFYEALAEFLVDLPLFPFACIKGPVVRMTPKLTWVGGRPLVKSTPQMFWERVSPFNVYWSPGASKIEDAEVIERKRLTRANLNDVLDLPGYDQDAVRAALQDYDQGLRDWLDSPDTEVAQNEGRENPTMNESEMIDAIEYHGNVQGRMLLDQGVDQKLIPDLDRDYSVQTWVVGQHTIKTQLNPSPRRRHPYYITSFERVPGSIAGHGLPDILEDLQEIANAALRALVNNLAISSGPQVVIDDERLAPTDNGDQLYPWKRWHVTDAQFGNNREPITFFQPQSNSQELLSVYTAITGLADDNSTIPRYATGESLKGGAGRTASGLSMLMGNSSKVLQVVAGNIDLDVMEPSLTGLYDMIMLTDTSGLLTGEEQIEVNGVTVALQKETERQKQLQFLQITANPIDAPIIGEVGRGRVLRAVAQNMGLPDDSVPDDETIIQQAKLRQALMVQQAQQQGPPGEPGSSPGAQAQGAQPQQATPSRLADHAPPVNLSQRQRGSTNA